ncbi:MAG: hypothetical protein JOZ07_03510 [Solirubrobacterales bacterium]|nr:hypothetical protein [Solirubrobacterales bacterium]
MIECVGVDGRVGVAEGRERGVDEREAAAGAVVGDEMRAVMVAAVVEGTALRPGRGA